MTNAPAPPCYRPPPPRQADLVRWPETFGTRFTVFCDVEEEFDWRAPLSRAARSTRAMAAFPDAHRRFASLDIPLTCMVDHPIATDDMAVDMLAPVLADSRSAIGAQLHPWVNPPFDEEVSPANSYLGNLPLTLQAAKIDALTAAITERLGVAPAAFRAGRYGVGPDTLALLATRGYRLDSSIRAFYDYRDDGGPDFRSIGSDAYHSHGLIELPFTTVFTGALHRSGPRLYSAASRLPHGPGVLARTGLLQRVSLTPEDMPLADALEAASVAVGEGGRLLSFAFHSPSLAAGHTPYVRDAADLAMFWRWWDAMADRLAQLGVRSASLEEILGAAD